MTSRWTMLRSRLTLLLLVSTLLAACAGTGTTPGAASFDTPSRVTNHGRLLATQVPTPMIKVCSTKP